MPASPQPAAQRHTPVLRDRVVELVAPALTKPGAVLIDATLGMGGHAEAVLSECDQARVIGIDRDLQALELATERLADYGSRFESAHAVYDDLARVASERAVAGVDAVFFDLGVSSLQLDDIDRGFSYSRDTPLDMRMDQSQGASAAEVVNTYATDDLTRVLRDYGEERYAAAVAKAIVAERDQHPFSSSQRLVEVVQSAIPLASQRTGGHPAKRTFQALRIEVNDELRLWRRAIEVAIALIKVGGRVVVLSYHSLEDRITKQAFTAGSTSSAPPGLPVELPEHSPYLRLLTRGAERASESEQQANPRSASVRLRGAERIRTSDYPPKRKAKGIAHV